MSSGGVRRLLRQLGNFLSQVSLVPPPPGAAVAAAAAADAARRQGVAAAAAAGLGHGPPMELELVSLSPLILTVRGFVTAAECAVMISAATQDGRAMMSADPRDRKFELDPWPSTGAGTGTGTGAAVDASPNVSSDDRGGAPRGADSATCPTAARAESRAGLMECVYDRIDGVLGAARQPAEVPPKVHFKAAGHGAEVEIDGAMASTSI